MLAFYRHDGAYVATCIEGAGDSVTYEGDFDFLENISNGSTSWAFHERLLSTFDDGAIRAVVLPDHVTTPITLFDALVLHVKLGMSNEPGEHPEYRIFSSFEFVGPMLVAHFPDEFQDWYQNSYQGKREEDFIHDVTVLVMQIPDDISPDNYENSDHWPRQISEFFDHAFLEIDPELSEFGMDEQSMLFKLAPGDWVELGDFYGIGDWDHPTTVAFRKDYLSNEAKLVAEWIESQNAGYLAAIALLIKPQQASDSEDVKIPDGEIEMREAFLELSTLFRLEIDVLSFDEEHLIAALGDLSPQFSEFRTLLSNPTSKGNRLLLEAAKDLNPGFAGWRGSIMEWL